MSEKWNKKDCINYAIIMARTYTEQAEKSKKDYETIGGNYLWADQMRCEGIARAYIDMANRLGATKEQLQKIFTPDYQEHH